MDWTRIGPASDLRPLLPVVRSDLLSLLRSLSRDQWARPTVCPGWTVHHLAGHIAHVYLGKLSRVRDGFDAGTFADGEDLPAFLARVNGEFAGVAASLSPAVLIDLIAHFGPQFDGIWAGADLSAAGTTDVSWIAPGVAAPVWVDLAREFSELWVHQQQLRDAVAVPGGTGPALLGAALDTLVRSLPRALSGVAAPPGAFVTVEVTGELSRAWLAVRDQAGWRLAGRAGGAELAHVTVPAGVLWRTAARGIEPADAVAMAQLTGDGEAGRAALHLLSIIR